MQILKAKIKKTAVKFLPQTEIHYKFNKGRTTHTDARSHIHTSLSSLYFLSDLHIGYNKAKTALCIDMEKR